MLTALIMAGGRGTRFWPASTEDKPKQFLSLTTENTMIQETVRRLLPLIDIENIFICTGAKYKALCLEQLPALPERNVIVEPVGRNTAPCILLSTLYISQIYPDSNINMMIDNNFSFIKVIDPRGKFGSYDIYGDSRYELAKLFHSVDGKYDYIIKDLFTIDYSDGNIEFIIQDKDREFDLYQVFTDVFKEEIGENLKKIELIEAFADRDEALLFLSMIPLHGENFNHQLVMLGTGLEILNRVVDVTESR